MRGSQRSDIKQTTFLNCQAGAGGALSANSMLQPAGVLLGLSLNQFTSNTASTQLPCPVAVCIDLDATLVGTQGDGGAATIDGCDLLLFNTNSFTSNVASGRGGAMFAQRPSDSAQIISLSDDLVSIHHPAPSGLPYFYHLSFINNSALVAGGALAMDGYQLTMSNVGSGTVIAQTYTLFQGNTAPGGKCKL